jgi:hypothetical protein
VRALLATCGGFLLAVLWFDLMFDVQVLGQAPPFPDSTLASIGHYYARVTGGAHPMQHLIALVMAVTVVGSLAHAWSAGRRLLPWVAFGTAVVPIGLAGTRVFPNAVRLGTGLGSPLEQSALARAIFVDHVFCWISIAVFTAIQIGLTRPARSGGPRD